METKDCTRNLLIEHYKKYPDMQIQDIFKFLFQSSFGCEHLIADPSATTDYIRREAAECHPHIGEFILVLGKDLPYYSVDLQSIDHIPLWGGLMCKPYPIDH